MSAMGGKEKKKKGTAAQAVILAALLLILAVLEVHYIGASRSLHGAEAVRQPLEHLSSGPQTLFTPASQKPPASSAGPTPTPTPTPTPLPPFEPHAVDATRPEKLIAATAVQVNGQTVTDYRAAKSVDFGLGEDYTAIPGVFTFRGNNFRDGGAYGTVSMTEKKLSRLWTQQLGALTSYNGETWTGSGWTGQALITQWDKAARQHMNLYDWAKEQDELTEVIHATMDGCVYFKELSTGKNTRDKLYLGFTFKGAGSLDPRGYPILYVGAGYYGASSAPRALAVSLIDGKVLFDLAASEDFALRQWHMFDSAPLVSAETDQLIWPGENGILYIVDMHTDYDAAAGTLTMEPQVVKWRYSSVRNNQTGQYWLGMEDSAVIYGRYLFVADNGGCLMCLDLDTLELVWVQDVLDDTNCTPVLELEDGHPYLYISTSFHSGWRSYTMADIPIWKIDAETGEVVWRTDFTCRTEPDLSGGVQGSIALGKNALSDLVFVPVARTPNAYDGKLVALDKRSGEIVWEQHTQTYSWVSPVCVYDEAGSGYILHATSGVGNSGGGYLQLIDGRTGKVLDETALGSTIEASPVAFGNYVVIGTRGQTDYCFALK